ncbi:hypothetical protein [Azonexus sp.]|jgi:hypothetical protein|nr:hypothetical protein [Azonexus sp.]
MVSVRAGSRFAAQANPACRVKVALATGRSYKPRNLAKSVTVE